MQAMERLLSSPNKRAEFDERVNAMLAPNINGHFNIIKFAAQFERDIITYTIPTQQQSVTLSQYFTQWFKNKGMHNKMKPDVNNKQLCAGTPMVTIERDMQNASIVYVRQAGVYRQGYGQYGTSGDVWPIYVTITQPTQLNVFLNQPSTEPTAEKLELRKATYSTLLTQAKQVRRQSYSVNY
jgi:hypothetical protein